MFLVEAGTPGLDIVRNIGLGGEAEDEGITRSRPLRQGPGPGSELLGPEGRDSRWPRPASEVAGCTTPCARWRTCQKALDMMCERASAAPRRDRCSPTSSTCRATSPTRGSNSSNTGYGSANGVEDRPLQRLPAGPRGHRGIKVRRPEDPPRHRGRAIQVHGALGISNEMPLWGMYQAQYTTGFSDGPSEVHKTTVARRVLKQYSAAPGLWPTQHLPPGARRYGACSRQKGLGASIEFRHLTARGGRRDCSSAPSPSGGTLRSTQHRGVAPTQPPG